MSYREFPFYPWRRTKRGGWLTANGMNSARGFWTEDENKAYELNTTYFHAFVLIRD